MTILPEILKEEFLRCKKNIDINTPVLTQGALEIYLKSSMYKSHVFRTKEFYQHKMDVVREACRLTASKETVFAVPPTGIYALIETERNTAEKVVRSLEKNKVLVQSIKSCYLEGYPAYEGIRLCVCNCSDEELTKSVKLIHELLHHETVLI
jgi:DNA-binding transcriptional MocR family regulator